MRRGSDIKQFMDKVLCVGKNYLDHARELGDAVPEAPIFFLKPPSAVIHAINFDSLLEVSLPDPSLGSVHYECEIVLRLSADGKFDAVTLGIDLTLRDLQSELKKNGHPWEIAKSFARSAIVGPWLPLDDHSQYLDYPFTFSTNGKIQQSSHGHKMRLAPLDCLKHAQRYFDMLPGDLFFTGTPAGVGPLKTGDKSELCFNNQCMFRVKWI